VDTFFRITTSNVEFELEGSEEFVRRETARFLPRLSDATVAKGDPAPASPLKLWYDERVPHGHPPSMQDSILIFGYFLKREKDRHLFSPGDIKRSFEEVDRKIPKSLLQIMGTLKRNQGLLCSPGDKRGRYALAPPGIRHVEKLLGIRRAGPPAPEARAEASPPDVPPDVEETDDGELVSGPEKWDRLFQPRGGLSWRRPGREGGAE